MVAGLFPSLFPEISSSASIVPGTCWLRGDYMLSHLNKCRTVREMSGSPDERSNQAT